jgi:hypothetical protein
MNDLDRWARDHRHRAKRAQIARIRCQQVALLSGAIAGGQIGMTYIASGAFGNPGSFGIGSGAIASPMLVRGCISQGLLGPTSFDWSKVYGSIGAG